MSLSQKKILFRIIAATVLFVVSFLLREAGYFKLALIIIAYLIASYDILFEAAVNIVNGQVFDEKFLMAIASVGAFAVGESHEAVFVMVFFQIGELFESLALGKSRRSVAALMDISPEYANILREGELVQISPDEVSVGDIIIVKPGERIPLDGMVVDGASSLNTSALTGESMPRDVAVGDSVISGCINLKGVLQIRVSKAFEDSTVTRILELVEQSSSNKSKSENFISRFARWYTPAVVFSALALALIPSLIFGNWTEWVHRALIFLVISCPCALVISVPLTYFGGIGCASRHGILVKGSNYLDALSVCESFVFDKTGTLTKGCFVVKEIHADNCSEELLLEIAAHAEAFSDHPIAECIRECCEGRIDNSVVDCVEEKSGFGVACRVKGEEVLCGSARLMNKHGIKCCEADVAGTAVHVALSGSYMGCIIIADEIKPDAAASLAQLKALGIKQTVMLTGDDKLAAESVGESLGISKIIFGLLPEDKLTELEKMLERGNTTAYVGDGINDAPCLARADVGIAMGALGSDAAIEAADIVLMDDKLSKLPVAISAAKKTKRIAKQNIVFALGVKFAVLILGAIGHAGMWLAVFADVGVCVLAILNAMRTQK